MKKILQFAFLLLSLSVSSQNIQLRANLSYGASALANIGGYVDSLGNEYALVGTDFGLSIVDVTVPDSPLIVFTVPGPTSEWREVKTYRQYAYVTTEAGGGLTVIDLHLLPASINYKQYTGDASIAGQLSSIHSLHCDTVTGFLYLYGSNIGAGNSLFIDLADPWNPHYAGQYNYPSGGSDAYVHDGYVMNDTMYEGHIYPGFFAVVDVRNKSNPILLATQTTPGVFTHNTWLSDDHKTLFTTDEVSNSYLTAYDISDLSNIRELSRFQTDPGSNSIVHNTHILHDFAITSWYTQGVVINDISHPDNPIEVGHYDTYPQANGNGFYGCWGVYPFLPSGNLVASDINNGLFVLTPTYIHACYLIGTVTDSVTGAFLNAAAVQVLSTSVSKHTNPSGKYATGIAASGLYDILVSKAGYTSRTIYGVNLQNGVTDTLNVDLVPLPTFVFSGNVTDSLSGLPISGVQVELRDSGFEFHELTDVAGHFAIPGVVAGTYDLVFGKWGYVSNCLSLTPNFSQPLQLQLTPGYYDDFSLDFGWTVTGSSPNLWQRGEPVGTYDPNNNQVNPEYDITGDCMDQCFVTDNGGGTYSNHDVDNGNTILTSPVFDATIYSNPTIEYYRWFINIAGSGTPNDSMKIKLNNGITTVTVENVLHNSPGNGTWVFHSSLISSLLTPTSHMILTVEVVDAPPGHVTEGALDGFRITGSLTIGIESPVEAKLQLLAYPNPFTGDITFTSQGLESGDVSLEILNVIGQIVEIYPMHGNNFQISTGHDLVGGVYFARLKSGSTTSGMVKIIKE